MGGPMLTRSDSKVTLGWGLAAALIVGCGASGADAGSQGACPSGDVYCAACDGGGFCSNACPGIECFASDGGGTFDGASDAAIIDGGACPASASTPCLDCNGGIFCVAGSCPAMTCPLADAGADARSDGCRVSPPDASADGGTVGCTSSTCPTSELCVESSVQGGAVQLPNDAGMCPPGTEKDTNDCLREPTYTTRCVPRPSACGSEVTCACAGTLCGSGAWICTSSPGASFLSCVEEVP